MKGILKYILYVMATTTTIYGFIKMIVEVANKLKHLRYKGKHSKKNHKKRDKRNKH